MTGFDNDEEWYDAHYNSKLMTVVRKQADAVVAANPKLAFVAKKLCEYDGRDPEHMVFSLPVEAMPRDAKGHASFTYMPRPMMQWMAYIADARIVFKALKEWDARSVEEQVAP